MSEKLNEFQKAAIESFQDGRLAELSTLDDYKGLQARLKKEPGTAVLAGVLDSLRGAEDLADATTRLMTAEADVQAAMAGIGAISMAQYRR